MTDYYIEKFYDEYSINKDGMIVAIVDSGSNARKVCDLLNELEKENAILRGPHHRRFIKKTVDNWESYIVDNFTGEEYGQEIDKLLFLLNTLSDKIINEQLVHIEKVLRKYYSNYKIIDPTFSEIIRLISKDLGVVIE